MDKHRILGKSSNFELATASFLRTGIALIALLPFTDWEVGKNGFMNRTGMPIAFGAGLFIGVDFIA